jgi:hypothetical protein
MDTQTKTEERKYRTSELERLITKFAFNEGAYGLPLNTIYDLADSFEEQIRKEIETMKQLKAKKASE